MKRKLLLIMPNFFDYPQAICEELENMGYEVDCFDDRPSTNGMVKAIIRVNKNLIGQYVQNPVYRAKGEIMSLTDKVSQMAKKREQLYADYVAGVVDSEDYQLIREDYSRQYDSLRAALQEAENKKVQVEQQIEEYLNMTSHLEEHLDNFEFDIHLVKTLVQRIEVSTDKRIRIVFGFRDIFAEAEKESAEK